MGGMVPKRRFAAFEHWRLPDAESLRPVLPNGSQGFEPVLDAAAEVDARGLVEVADRYGNVSQLEAEIRCLHEKFRIEYEVVAVVFERDRLQHLTAIRTKAAMKIPQILT